MMVTTIASQKGPTGTGTNDRHQHALAALALVTEPDLELVGREYQRLFSPHMRLVGFARQLCPLYAHQLAPGEFYAFDEKELLVQDLEESGDRVIAHVLFKGCHRPSQHSSAPDRWYAAHGIVVFRFAADQIDEAWAVLQWQ
jgi:hypothetical protein